MKMNVVMRYFLYMKPEKRQSWNLEFSFIHQGRNTARRKIDQDKNFACHSKPRGRGEDMSKPSLREKNQSDLSKFMDNLESIGKRTRYKSLKKSIVLLRFKPFRCKQNMSNDMLMLNELNQIESRNLKFVTIKPYNDASINFINTFLTLLLLSGMRTTEVFSINGSQNCDMQ